MSLQVQQRVNDVPALVTLAFSLLNQAATSSGVDITFQNAGIFNTGYNDNLSNTNVDLLNRLSNRNDTVLGGPVNTYRNTHRAHLAAMLTSNDRGGCGVAHMPATANFPTSVMADYCVTGYLRFNHEIGHNFDADHNWSNSSQRPTPRYAHGLQQTRTAPFWRTAMSYPCTSVNCPLVNIYSNPNRTHNGIPTGTVAYENNVRRINEYRQVVETFVPGGPVSPPFRLESRAVRGQCLDILGGDPQRIGSFICQANSANQRWVTDNTGRIISNANRNLCLGGNGDGANITLHNCSSTSPNILWTESNENYINRSNNQLLNALQGAASNARVNLSPANGSLLQRWLRVNL